jgi:hypothetical protein
MGAVGIARRRWYTMMPDMAYDEDLAHRVRELIAEGCDATERRMFGGLAFLVDGNMSVAASGQGGLMVRVDPDDTEVLSPGRMLGHSRCVAARCGAGCESSQKACEPRASSNPGSSAASPTRAPFLPSAEPPARRVGPRYRFSRPRQQSRQASSKGAEVPPQRCRRGTMQFACSGRPTRRKVPRPRRRRWRRDRAA